MMNRLSTLALGLCAIWASCQDQPAKESTETSTKDSVSASTTVSARPVHWGYKDESGPANWAALTPVYALCGNGQTQSPIDIVPATGAGTPAWKMEYKTTSLQIAHNEHMDELINNGHTIQVNPDPGSSLNYAGKVYNLKQFHFHTPSEHTINGKHAPMEIHFVHQADDKSLAVVGVLVEEGKHNKNFDQLIKYLPNAPGEKKSHDSVNINTAFHVPEQLVAYHYVGSLTTPPCTEQVQWMVLRNPIQMSKEQIAAFSSRIGANNRPTQPLHGRNPSIDDISSKK